MDAEQQQKVKQWEEWSNARHSVIVLGNRHADAISVLHKTHLGGSETAALMNLSKWHTACDIYDRMQTNEVEDVDNFVFARGHACEQFVAEQAGKILKMHVSDGSIFFDKPSRPWSISQVDRFIGDAMIPLEIKVATVNTTTDDGKAWGRGCQINDFGQIMKEDDLIPVDYFLQCQKQMYFTDKQWMYLAAWLTFENKIRIFLIHRDEEIIKRIVEVEDDFMFNHVIPKVRPQEVVPVASTQAFDKTEVYTADAKFEALCKEYNSLSSEIKDLKERTEQIKKKLSDQMDHCGIAVNADGKKLLTITEVKTQTFDKKKFANEHAELYGLYLKEGFGGFRFTFAKEA